MRYNHIPKINIISYILFFLSFFTVFFSGKIVSKEIKIGTSIPLTGQFSNIGKYYHDAYKFTIDKINESGGVKVNNSFKKLSLKLYDNQSNIGINKCQYIKLITEDNINFLLGPFLNNFILNNSFISEKYKTIIMQSCGISNQILSNNFKYVFGLFIPAKNYSLNTIDFTSLIAQIKNINAKIIFFSGYETNIINFIRQIKIFKIKPMFFSLTSDLLNKNIRNLLKNENNYTYGITPWLPNFNFKDRWFSNAKNFSNEYKKKFGYYPDYHSIFAVIDIESLVYAIEKSNDLNPLKVKKQLKKLNFNSIYGKIPLIKICISKFIIFRF